MTRPAWKLIGSVVLVGGLIVYDQYRQEDVGFRDNLAKATAEYDRLALDVSTREAGLTIVTNVGRYEESRWCGDAASASAVQLSIGIGANQRIVRVSLRRWPSATDAAHSATGPLLVEKGICEAEWNRLMRQRRP
ncbi:MAG: hypothetical protein AAB368_01720 [bacterium]